MNHASKITKVYVKVEFRMPDGREAFVNGEFNSDMFVNSVAVRNIIDGWIDRFIANPTDQKLMGLPVYPSDAAPAGHVSLEKLKLDAFGPFAGGLGKVEFPKKQ